MTEPSSERVEGDPLEQMREHLAEVPAGEVVAEAALSLVAVAYMRLGIPPEQNERYRDLDAARLLIDAFAGLLAGVRGRLGPIEPQLEEVLASLRLAFADVAAHLGGGHPAAAPPPAAPEAPAPGGRRPSGLWVPGMD
jgi:hypothetical protein